MSLVTLVAAVARDGAIGRDNALLWHIPEDMARFKALTAGKPVVMGRRTWDSLPPKFRPLPGRRNLVVSRNLRELAGAEVFPSLDDALAAYAGEPEVCVIGGSDIYALALPFATRLALTEVDLIFPDADRHFPAWPRNQFTEARREAHTGANGLGFDFVDYIRQD
ncbi:dihydrofolate reductase [Roseateles saccharophilus]|uniref:Dihydrofolate reductase n=1 Tax=Roseateles saccharophilus TaxID=304 RepID=A0A4R3U7A1_ROSSA|nr:dihydrofolate reductase [Roseateles saccharophilus]MDG0835953.1 dihydrofolate reductase [Roseateles saccharophilus]TCU82620.1 dihydrofolate reductase [Roseateles saccharophilus]